MYCCLVLEMTGTSCEYFTLGPDLPNAMSEYQVTMHMLCFIQKLYVIPIKIPKISVIKKVRILSKKKLSALGPEAFVPWGSCDGKNPAWKQVSNKNFHINSLHNANSPLHNHLSESALPNCLPPATQWCTTECIHFRKQAPLPLWLFFLVT